MPNARKLFFVPDARAPLVTEENVEEVTHVVIKKIVNAFLWQKMRETELVPFVNVRGCLPSGDIAVNWFPAAVAAELESQFWTTEDPEAKALRVCDRLEHDFQRGALAKYSIAKAKHSTAALKLQEEWERKRLEEGCG